VRKEVHSFSKIKIQEKAIHMQTGYSGVPSSLDLTKKTVNKANPRGTGEDQEAQAGGLTSMAARKTTVQRDRSENLSFRVFQGSVQTKVAKWPSETVSSRAP